jgi:hypothetical protein
VNGIEPVSRGEEEHPGQVEWQVEVIIGESMVLLRVEHFQQRGCRIAAEIGTDLVDFIEENDWIVGFDSAQALNDASGQSAHIGSAMATDFGFIPHATE